MDVKTNRGRCTIPGGKYLPPESHHRHAGWRTLSIITVLIIIFPTALLIVHHIVCSQLKHLLLLLLLLHFWYALLADFSPYAALCWMACISWWMGKTFSPCSCVWRDGSGVRLPGETGMQLFTADIAYKKSLDKYDKHDIYQQLYSIRSLHFLNIHYLRRTKHFQTKEACSHSSHIPRFLPRGYKNQSWSIFSLRCSRIETLCQIYSTQTIRADPQSGHCWWVWLYVSDWFLAQWVLRRVWTRCHSDDFHTVKTVTHVESICMTSIHLERVNSGHGQIVMLQGHRGFVYRAPLGLTPELPGNPR